MGGECLTNYRNEAYETEQFCQEIDVNYNSCMETGKDIGYCKIMADMLAGLKFGVEKTVKTVLHKTFGKAEISVPTLDEICADELTDFDLTRDETAQLCEKQSDVVAQCDVAVDGNTGFCKNIAKSVWQKGASVLAGLKIQFNSETDINKAGQASNSNGILKIVCGATAVGAVLGAAGFFIKKRCKIKIKPLHKMTLIISRYKMTCKKKQLERINCPASSQKYVPLSLKLQ